MPAPMSVRRRLAPVAATVMALAVGVAVGAGPLSDVGVGADQLAARTGTTGLTDGTAAEALDAADALAVRASGPLYADGLDGRGVALVAMPGADADVVDGLGNQVEAAGGTVTARYAVGDEMVARGGTALVDSLGRRLLEQQPALPVDAGAPAYERIGGLAGMVVASTEADGQEPVPATRSVGASLREAGLLEGPRQPATRAPYVVVVLADDPDAPAEPDEATDAIATGLLDGLAGRSAGTVVVGSVAAGADGLLQRLRAADATGAYTTVDGVDRVVGRVVTTLAVLAATGGTSGSWGVRGADGVVPPAESS